MANGFGVVGFGSVGHSVVWQGMAKGRGVVSSGEVLSGKVWFG